MDAHKSNELALGDEDVKYVEEAEKRAKQSAERKRKKMAGKVPRSWTARQGSQPSMDTNSLPEASKTIMAMPASQHLPKRVPGPCFHWNLTHRVKQS